MLGRVEGSVYTSLSFSVVNSEVFSGEELSEAAGAWQAEKNILAKRNKKKSGIEKKFVFFIKLTKAFRKFFIINILKFWKNYT